MSRCRRIVLVVRSGNLKKPHECRSKSCSSTISRKDLKSIESFISQHALYSLFSILLKIFFTVNIVY